MKDRRVVFGIVGFAVCFCVPLVVTMDYTLQVLFRIFLFAALGLAWNLVGGYAGQLSLGHAAYFGAGAYGLALFHKAGLPIWLSLLLAIAVAVLFALLIGGVCFRLRGPYFALATIASAEVLRLIAKNLVDVTGGDVGAQVPPLFTGAVNRSFYLAAVLLTAVAYAITVWVSRSKFGYYLMAIREDEDTALSVGVNAPRYKLWVLLISAALTALGGALYGSLFLFIVPDQVLSIEISNEIAIVPMLGGAGTVGGPIIGAVILESASEIFKNIFQEAHLLIYGVLLVLVVLFLPEGIVGSLNARLRRRRNTFFAGKVAPQSERTTVKM
jgi:branched-chain amino acid transport system permease protein